MPYDLTQPRKLPLSHGKHVILNTVNGDTVEVEEHLAEIAMLQFFQDPANRGWAEFVPVEERESVMAWVTKIGLVIATRSEWPKNENDVIKVGPFVTWDACIHAKNDEVLTQSLERFVELGGELVRPIDRILAAQLRSQADEDGHTPHEDSLVAEAVPERGKVNTVKDVLGRSGRGMPPGFPPELAAIFGGLGGLGGKMEQIAPGVFGMRVDLDDLFDRKKKGDDKKDD